MTAQKKSTFMRLFNHKDLPNLKQRFSQQMPMPQFSSQFQQRRSCDTSVYNYNNSHHENNDNQMTARNSHKSRPFGGLQMISPIKSHRQSATYANNFDQGNVNSSQMLNNQEVYHNSDKRNQSEEQLMEMTMEMNSLKQAINRANYIADFLAEENYLLSHNCMQANNELQQLKQFYQQKLQAANTLIQQLHQKCTQYQSRLSLNNAQIPMHSSTSATAYQSNPSHSHSYSHSPSPLPATPSSQTAHNNNNIIILPKSGKITPIKVYNKNNQVSVINHQDTAIMQDIAKMLWKDRIAGFWNDVHALEQITDKQKTQLEKTIQQHKYLQAYIEDQVLFRNRQIQSAEMLSYQSIEEHNIQLNTDSVDMVDMHTGDVSHLLKTYQTQILLWQNYATTLKKQLSEAISFIQKMSIPKPKQHRQKSYTSKDLIKYISKQIQGLVLQKLSKQQRQNTQLKELLDEVFKQMKKRQKHSPKKQKSDTYRKYSHDDQKKQIDMKIDKDTKRSKDKKLLSGGQDEIMGKYISN